MTGDGAPQVSAPPRQTPRRAAPPVFIERSYIPKKQKGGSISKTDNKQLLALLVEKSKSEINMAKPEHRPYVESPSMSKDDENEYQFVNPDIDDELEDDTEFETQRRKMFDNRGARRSYGMPERDSLEETSDIELKREEEYQRQLQARIEQAKEHDALKLKYDIPKLDLNESTDSLEENPRDSIEDSLDVEQNVQEQNSSESYKDSLDWRNPPPNPLDSQYNQRSRNNEPDWSDPVDDSAPQDGENDYERYEDMNKHYSEQEGLAGSQDSNQGEPGKNSYEAQVEFERRKSDLNQRRGNEQQNRTSYESLEDSLRARNRAADDVGFTMSDQEQHEQYGDGEDEEEDTDDKEYDSLEFSVNSRKQNVPKHRQVSHNQQNYDSYRPQSGDRGRPKQRDSGKSSSQNPPQNLRRPDFQGYEPQTGQYFLNGPQNGIPNQPIPQPFAMSYYPSYDYQYPPQGFPPQPPMGYAHFQQYPMSRSGYPQPQAPPQGYYGQPPAQIPVNQYHPPMNQSLQYAPVYGLYQAPGQFYQQQPFEQPQQQLQQGSAPSHQARREYQQEQEQLQQQQQQQQLRRNLSDQQYQDEEQDEEYLEQSEKARGSEQQRIHNRPSVRDRLQVQEKQDENIPRPVKKSPFVERPARLNFVEFNKKVLNEGTPRKGYGDRFKERKEITTPMSENGRLTRTVKKPPLQMEDRKMKAASAGDIGRLEKTTSGAEDLWKERAHRLSSHKEQVSSGKKASGYGKSLKKYASDSNLKKPVARPPHHIEPIPQKVDHQAVTTSKRVEVPVSAWNDDQQRVSVDINLKLISPQPPLGPIHKANSTRMHNNNADFERQNRNNYYNQQWSQYVEDPGTVKKDSGYTSSYDGRGEMGHANHVRTVEENEMEDQGYYDQESNDEEERYKAYTSPRDNLSTTRGSPTVNPYHKIPPISGQKKGKSGEQKENGGSYMQEYSKQKDRANKKPTYKKYTVEDYRKLKLEISLGGLGPALDEDTWKEKAEKRKRQLNYAKQVAIENRPAQGKVKPVSYVREEVKEDDIMNRRKVALEYSKSVPKPKVAPKRTNHGGAALTRHAEDEEEAEQLRQLQERHARDRSEIADLRSNIGSVLSTAR